MTRSAPRHAARALTLALSITVVGLAGTAGHSWAAPPPDTAGGQVAPETNPPATAPPETSPPETVLPDTVPGTIPTTVPDDDDGIDVGTWLLLTLIIVLAIIVISAVVTGISRRSKPKATPVVAPVPAPTGTDTAHQLLASAQWVHDQLSLELMAAAPEQALGRWSVERSRIDNIVIGTQAEASRLNSASWLQLGQFMSELATAIDTNLRLRVQVPPNVGMIQESANVITVRRNDVQAAINMLRPTLG